MEIPSAGGPTTPKGGLKGPPSVQGMVMMTIPWGGNQQAMTKRLWLS